MFACVRDDNADESSIIGSSTARMKTEIADDDEIINRVLEEGLRLKKRCKSLTQMLEEKERQLMMEREARENANLTLHEKVQFELSKADTAHAMELSRLREEAQHECHGLAQQVDHLRGLLQQQAPRLAQLEGEVLAREQENERLVEELYQLKAKQEADKKVGKLSL